MKEHGFLYGLAILVPMAVYLIAAFRIERPPNYKAFLYPSNRITADTFANSSTAYNLQVAAFSFFFFLGFTSPIAALINILFWSAGIFLFRKYIGNLKRFFGREISLNAFLSEGYDSKSIRLIAGMAVFLAFMGLLLAELLFGSLVLLALGIDEFGRILVTFAFAFFVLLYFRRGGKLSVLHTDQHQLVFSYLGLFSVLSWALIFGYLSAADAQGNIAVLSAFALFLLFLSWRTQEKRDNNNLSIPRSTVEKTISMLFILMMVITLFIALLGMVSLKSPTELFQNAVRGIPEFSIWAYLSAFLVTPLFWQFGDVTNWHRLGAVIVHKDNSQEEDLRTVQRGLLRYGIQSPVSIAIIAVLGAAAHYSLQSFSSEDAYNVIVTLPTHLLAEPTTIVFGLLFVVAIVGIMLSTTDSYLASAVFVFTYDIWKPSRDLIENQESTIEADVKETHQDVSNALSEKIINTARKIAIATMVGGLLVYTMLVLLNIDVLTWLFFGFAVPLSFVPAVFGLLLLSEPEKHRRAAEMSIFIGLVAAVGSFIYAQFDANWSYLPPLVTMVVSTLIFMFPIITQEVKMSLLKLSRKWRSG